MVTDYLRRATIARLSWAEVDVLNEVQLVERLFPVMPPVEKLSTSRKKPCLRNRVEEHIEKAIVGFALEKPAYGQLCASNELKKKGMFVSPDGVRSIWLRHDLETFQKRLKALEAKMAQENLILTEEQLRALEKAKDEKESHGEIESLPPGYLGA